MLKSLFLNHKSKGKSPRKEHCTYVEAENIGILYNADEFDNDVIEELIDSVEGDGKSSAKLGFVDKPTEERLLFSKKDISSTGTIKKDQVGFFTVQSFDFLISLNTSENINYKYILSICNAACKIGLETEAYSQLLQMSLKPDADKLISTRNIIKYLKKI